MKKKPNNKAASKTAKKTPVIKTPTKAQFIKAVKDNPALLKELKQHTPKTKRADLGGSPTGYSAGAYNRLTKKWNASILGPNTLAEINLQTIRRRSRDMVRDSTLAESAINKWVSNVIGTGIVPHFLNENANIRKTIQDAWDKWTKKADYDGIDSFYGLQQLAARELFEAGEVFVRFHVKKDGNLTIQLIESEQLSEFRNISNGTTGNVTKLGIVFNSDNERIGYDLWKVQPYDIVVENLDAGKYIFIPAEEMLHVMRRTRAGQLRPAGGHLTSALISLHQIENYDENERIRKEMAACFAIFITRLSGEDSILPGTETTDLLGSPDRNESRIEPGTAQYLEVGEDVKFPNLPESNDYASFMSLQLHKVSAALNITYEQLTNDMKGVSFSSIRAGALEFRRHCEQYQSSVIVHQLCDPIMKRWMKESVLNGSLELPEDYYENPEPYEAAQWVAPGWDWINPKDEVDAYLSAIRAGFKSRTQVCRAIGEDPELVDAQQAQERERASKLGIIYDSDPNKVLIGKETPGSGLPTDPNQDSDSQAEDASEN
jgi:lambda family phage portal protein